MPGQLVRDDVAIVARTGTPTTGTRALMLAATALRRLADQGDRGRCALLRLTAGDHTNGQASAISGGIQSSDPVLGVPDL